MFIRYQFFWPGCYDAGSSRPGPQSTLQQNSSRRSSSIFQSTFNFSSDSLSVKSANHKNREILKILITLLNISAVLPTYMADDFTHYILRETQILGLSFFRNSFQDSYFDDKIIQLTQVVLTRSIEMAAI